MSSIKFINKMKSFINDQIRQGSFSVDIKGQYKPCVFLTKERISYNSKINQYQKNISSEITRVQKLPHLSHSEEIIFIKQQIKKLRTESPQVYYTNSEKPPLFSPKSKKDKRKEEMSKIVLSKLKRERTREYSRELKKSRVMFPKLGMEGKSCWSPEKGRYIISWTEEKQKEDQSQILPLQNGIRLKRALKLNLTKPSNILTSQKSIVKKRDQSVVGGWEKNTLTQQENQLLY